MRSLQGRSPLMGRHTASPRRRVPPVGLLVALLSLPPVAGCALPKSPPNPTTPREWRDRNPSSPEANAARAAGTLQPLRCPAAMDVWEEFGRRHIQEGDILFRYGVSYDLTGWFTGC